MQMQIESYLDYHSAMADERKGLISTYSGDGVHPNKAGNQLMALRADEAIKQALTLK
jgi:lysophospholipase L1-like esterase